MTGAGRRGFSTRGLPERFAAVPIAVVSLFVCPWAAAEPPVPETDIAMTGFFDLHCLDCHRGRRAAGGVVLDRLAEDPHDPDLDAELLLRVRDRLRAQDMPPIDVEATVEENLEFRPSAEEYERMVGGLGEILAARAAVAGVPGVVTRRLSRRELEATILDVFGPVDGLEAAIDGLPADDIGHGFDHLGEVLSTSSLLLEKIVDLAELVAQGVVTDAARYEPKVRVVPLEKLRGGSMRAVGVWRPSRGEIAADVVVPRPGRYRLEFDLAGQQAGPDPVRFGLRVDRRTLDTVQVAESPDRPATYSVEFEAKASTIRAGAVFLNDYFDPENPDRSQRDRNALVAGLRLVGPLDPPAPGSFQRSMTAAMARGDVRTGLARATRRLLEHGWCRPIPSDEAYRVADLVLEASGERTGTSSIADRLRALVVYTIASPEFLYRIERNRPGSEPSADGTVPLDGHSIARRLAAFLRGGPPDDRLLEAARRGTLDRSEGILREARRLMRMDAPRSLAENFAVQWLHVDGVEGLEPDPARFGDIDPATLADMREETVRAFQQIVEEDRPITDLFSADTTWLSARLARHYRIEGADLPERGFHRVDLAALGLPQAELGVLRHASVLMSTSNPTRTSPVKRGRWILESLLDRPPPPPPPGADQLPSVEGEDIGPESLREMLERHRSDPDCASCHVHMDALGFALESMDAVGRWRSGEGEEPIDTAAVLPDGTSIEGPEDLRDLLIRDPRLIRSFGKHLFIYALGRGPEWRDEGLLDRIGEVLAENPRVSTAIETIVTSDAFRRRPTESSTR